MPDPRAATGQNTDPALPNASVNSLTTAKQGFPGKPKEEEEEMQVAEPGCRGGGVLSPHGRDGLAAAGQKAPAHSGARGCHADPQAVFVDVIFDFTRLELQLRHFATQGCHDSRPHVPRVAHTLVEEEGLGWLPCPDPHQTSTPNPLEGGGQECGGGKHLGNQLASTLGDGETKARVGSLLIL